MGVLFSIYGFVLLLLFVFLAFRTSKRWPTDSNWASKGKGFILYICRIVLLGLVLMFLLYGGPNVFDSIFGTNFAERAPTPTHAYQK